ncbi:MAG TPA: HAMP domain-containing sensor histidine kinase [Planctomycetota bacterium]|nr:HAMP domain-containing sensor histidine kinase [Planctomycetota bacterium]
MSQVAASRLPGVLGHELRNPLASAMTGIMLVREMVDADDPRAQLLDGALRDLDRLTGIIDGWLAMARTGRASAGRVSVDRLVRSAAGRHGAEVLCCPLDAHVEGNAALLERAIDNLCENARQAGARTIRIAVQCLDDEVSLHIEDDGCGVPKDQLERIFAAGWSSRGGAGLGLHVVGATVAAHRGSIRCVALARGTRFTITLPLAASRPALA